MSKINSTILICAAIVLLALFACNSDKPTRSISTGELPYEYEAQVMAIFYSGEMRPPEDLTRQISHELTLLRDTWQDSIPDVNIPFMPPWTIGLVRMNVDDTAFSDIITGDNRRWDSLCDYLGVSYYHYIPSIGTYVATRSKDVPLNPLRLAPYFVGFPGIGSISTEGGPLLWRYLVRLDDNGTIEYFTRSCCHPDIFYTYHYFVIEHDRALLIDRHCECHPAFDSILRNAPPDSSYWILQAYADSMEQARPGWVDTSRQLLHDIDYGEQFMWSRPTK